MPRGFWTAILSRTLSLCLSPHRMKEMNMNRKVPMLGLITLISLAVAGCGGGGEGSVASSIPDHITLTSTQGSTTPVAPPTLAAGTNVQLYATGSYNDGSTQDITAAGSVVVQFRQRYC